MDSKDFSSLSLTQFKRFAAKTHLSEKLLLQTVEETVQAFSEAWKTFKDLPIKKDVHDSILKHLKTIPFWNKI